MSLKNSTTKLSAAPQEPLFTVKFSDDEYHDLTLNIPRALALADVMTIADQAAAEPHPESMGHCVSMLYELLFKIGVAWEEATDRQADA